MNKLISKYYIKVYFKIPNESLDNESIKLNSSKK